MADFRLVFRGEVAQGQHLAVVKKRLKQALKLDDDRVDRLFCGKPVVVRKQADATLAARFRGVFKEAGATLHVVALDADESAPAPARADSPSQPVKSPGRAVFEVPDSPIPESPTVDSAKPTRDEASPTRDEASPTRDEASPTRDEAPPTRDDTSPDTSTEADGSADRGLDSGSPDRGLDSGSPDRGLDSGAFELAPTGSDVLSPEERSPDRAVDIEVGHIELAQQGEGLMDEVLGNEQIAAVDVSHLTLAEAGETLGPANPQSEDPTVPSADSNWELADAGALLGSPATPVESPVPDVDFDLAEPGSELSPKKDDTPPAAPATDHLKLEAV